MADTDKKRKTELRGVRRCKECLWYIGNNMLRRTGDICPICDAVVEKEKK